MQAAPPAIPRLPSPVVILLLSALLSFQSFDAGLPRSGQWRHSFAVADMNGDGAPDLAFSSPRKQPGPPVIFLNQGDGRWRRWEEAKFPALPFDYGAVAAADFDGNGANDLALGAHYRGFIVLVGDGRGTFVASQEGLTYPTTRQQAAAFSSRAIVVVDWNRDGRPDVAALSDGPRPLVGGTLLGVTVFENLGSAWKQTRALPDVVFGDSIAAGDVDGDGLPDILTASHNIKDQRVLRLGSGPVLERRAVETTVPPGFVRAVEVHDFDGDGRDEMVLAYTSITEPRETAIDIVSFPVGSGPPRRLWSQTSADVISLGVGDLNGDGASDLVAGLYDGRLLTFRGGAGGTLSRDSDITPPEWRRGCSAYGLRVADLNADGRDEIIAGFAGEESGCPSRGGIEVWRTVSSGQRRRAVRH